MIIIGFQWVLIGSNFAQTSEVIQELAQERAKERIRDKKAKTSKQQDKIKEEKALIKIRHKEEAKKKQINQKPRSCQEDPKAVKEVGALDKELKDWLDKLKAIESTLQ